MLMHTSSWLHRVVAVTSSAALYVATSSVQPAIAQPAETPRACFEIYANLNTAGKAVLSIPLEISGQDKDGRTLVEVDPACLAELGKAVGTMVDPGTVQPDDTKKVVDEAIDQMQDKGLTVNIAKKAKEQANKAISEAREDNKHPSAGLSGAALAKAPSSSKDDAMVGAVLAIAAVCTVASSGICAAAIAQVLPSLLSPKITNEEIKGITRAVTSVATGQVPDTKDLATVADVITRDGKDPNVLITDFTNLAEKIVIDQVAQMKLGGDKGPIVAQIIIDAAKNGKMDCGAVKKVLKGESVVVPNDFEKNLLKIIKHYRYGDKLTPEIQECLKEWVDN